MPKPVICTLSPLTRAILDCVEQGVDGGAGVLLAEVGALGYLVDQFGFGHVCPPGRMNNAPRPEGVANWAVAGAGTSDDHLTLCR